MLQRHRRCRMGLAAIERTVAEDVPLSGKPYHLPASLVADPVDLHYSLVDTVDSGGIIAGIEDRLSTIITTAGSGPANLHRIRIRQAAERRTAPYGALST